MISLYGKLARDFKKKYKRNPRNLNIKVKSASEAIRAMEANYRGFRNLIKKSGYYVVKRGSALMEGKDISTEELAMTFGNTHFHFMPVAAGCGGNGGIFNMVLGAALIVVGIIFPAVGAYTIPAGIGLMLSGISMMLMPTPSMGDYKGREKPEERPSYLFDGPRNRAAVGATVPLIYGETFAGSIFISGGLKVEDIV